jgi:hypothetical protein
MVQESSGGAREDAKRLLDEIVPRMAQRPSQTTVELLLRWDRGTGITQRGPSHKVLL